MSNNDNKKDIVMSFESENEEEWETIYNEDYKEKQTDENGREYLDYWTYVEVRVVVIWSIPITMLFTRGTLSLDLIKED